MDALVAELERICGREAVVTHPHQLRTYESDGLLQYAVTPGAVVLPENAEQVQAVVRACHDREVPWGAPRGGGGVGGGRRGRGWGLGGGGRGGGGGVLFAPPQKTGPGGGAL